MFALACPQHLMDVGGADPDLALRVALEDGWSVVLGGDEDLGALRQLLCQRDDLDEDGVATLGVQRELARQEAVLALLEGEDQRMSAIVARLRS